MTPEDIAFDLRHIWHPYTSMSNPLPAYPIVSAKGVELVLADGRKLIDGMSSWWAAIMDIIIQNSIMPLQHS